MISSGFLEFLGGLITGIILAAGAAFAWLRSRAAERSSQLESPAKLETTSKEKEVEERYRDLFENANDAVFIVGLNGRISLANRTFYDVTGYSEQEVLGSEFSKFVHSDDLSTALQRFRTRLEGEALSDKHVFRVRRKDGEYIIVEFSFGLLRESGRVAGIQGIARDVTESRRTAEALKESEHKYKTLVENSLTGIYLIQDGKYCFANRKFLEMSGYTEEEIMGNVDPRALTHPEDWPWVAEKLRMRLEGSIAPMEYEMRGIRKDGRIVPIKVLSERVMYRGKLAVMGTILDLSEQKEIEEHYRIILENALEGIYQSSPEGRLTMVNRALVEMFGFDSAEQMLALPSTESLYANPRDRSRFKERVDREGYVKNVELELKRRDGAVIFAEESGRVVRSAHGEVLGYEGILQDITERKLSAERMHRIYEVATSITGDSQDVLDQLAAHIAETFQTTYAEIGELEGEHVNVRSIVPDAVKGFTSYELSGTPCERVLAEGQACHFNDQVTLLFPSDEALQKLGIRSYLGCPLIDSKRQVIGITCVFHTEPRRYSDADEQLLKIFAQRASLEIERARQTEENEKVRAQLVQAQKMESIGTLAGGIAHDFNNLLTVIIGYASLMMAELDQSHPWFDQLQQIERTAQRGSQLTAQMLAFSRRAITQPANVDPNTLAREVLGILSRSLDPSIQIDCRLEQSVWTIRADPSQVQHVLMNLCVNAKDAMPEKGLLTIETKNVTLNEEEGVSIADAHAGRYVVFSVEDTGTGIDEATLARVFEPFFTTKEVGKGTGLGLSVVYGIVKTHGGYVQARSTPGVGTRFEIAFPAAPESAEFKGELSSLKGSEALLLVDDEALVLDLGKAVLQRFGYRVKTARNAEQAIACLRDDGDDISLAILDVKLPGIDGVACLKELRRLRPGLKAVLASGSSRRTDLDADAAAEIRFIEKPYRIHELVKAVRETLEA